MKSENERALSDINSTDLGALTRPRFCKNLEEHEIEKLYSFKDFMKYKCDGIILSIITGLIVSACSYYVIINL